MEKKYNFWREISHLGEAKYKGFLWKIRFMN